jgi:hypothetical protein
MILKKVPERLSNWKTAEAERELLIDPSPDRDKNERNK